MKRTGANAVEFEADSDVVSAAVGVLREIQREFQDEQRRMEDWFEVEDKEMQAYHRGKTRGLLYCIETLEANLKLAGAIRP